VCVRIRTGCVRYAPALCGTAMAGKLKDTVSHSCGAHSEQVASATTWLYAVQLWPANSRTRCVTRAMRMCSGWRPDTTPARMHSSFARSLRTHALSRVAYARFLLPILYMTSWFPRCGVVASWRRQNGDPGLRAEFVSRHPASASQGVLSCRRARRSLDRPRQACRCRSALSCASGRISRLLL
jgi:hypothetical protein